MNNFNDNNNTISLEEDNSFEQPRNITNNKKNNKDKKKTSTSFFDKIINSVSKIGQSLKSIMSKKIEIENEDDYNPNLYNQILNRFNTSEEMSLIDAPSFMEESNIENKSNKKDESNLMMISQNEIKNDNNFLNNISSFKNSFHNRKEGILNTDLEKNNRRKYDIKSKLLNKKRASDRQVENIFDDDEEEKNEEENLDINMESNEKNYIQKNKIEDSLNSSRIKSNNKSNYNLTNNSFKKNKLNNTSMMSISMKSLDDIKSELNKRKEENLRSIEEMHKRHRFNDTLIKERKKREEKILDEYYKEKLKKNAEIKLKLELDKRKREEEFKKLKIRKVSGLNYNSIKKKPHFLSEIKNTEIHFKPNSNSINNDKFNLLQKEEKKEPNTIPKVSNSSSLNITFGNHNPSQTNEYKVDNISTKENNEVKPKEEKNIFGFSQTKTEEINKKKDTEKKLDKGIFGNLDKKESIINNQKNNNQPEKKTTSSLFGNDKPPEKNKNFSLFGNDITPETNSSPALFGINMKTEQNKSSIFDNTPKEKNQPNSLLDIAQKEKKSPSSLSDNTQKENNLSSSSLFNANINFKAENAKVFDNKQNSMLDKKPEEKKEESKTNKENLQEEFFGSSSNLDLKTGNVNSWFKGSGNTSGIFGTQISNEKGGLFNQDNQVSQGINSNTLFSSNKTGNSLVDQNNNPFINHKQVNQTSTTNLFGAPNNNDNNQTNQQQNPNSFPPFSFGKSINPKSSNLFG